MLVTGEERLRDIRPTSFVIVCWNVKKPVD